MALAGGLAGLLESMPMFGPLLSTSDPDTDGGANVGQLGSLTDGSQAIKYMPRLSGIPISVSRVD